jgi:hypothetical protein
LQKYFPTIILKMILAALLLHSVRSQGQWARRVYWNDNQCAGEYAMAIQVLIPHAPCQSQTPLNQICEIKSTGKLKSSEGTGCDAANTISDQPWLPKSAVGKPVNGASYLTITQYAGSSCDGSGKVSMEQNSFAADGKCYAVESQNSFFKATCSGSTGKLEICKDPDCQDCAGALLNAGTFQQNSITFDNDQCRSAGPFSLKMKCIDAAQIAAIVSGVVGSTQTVSGSNPSSSPSNAKNSAPNARMENVLSGALGALAVILF